MFFFEKETFVQLSMFGLAPISQNIINTKEEGRKKQVFLDFQWKII